MNERHTEFFGPDLARGPFSSNQIETAAVQIATALAQLRTPLTRDDEAIKAHADFIRELADRLAPDWAAQVTMGVGDEIDNTIQTSIRVVANSYSLLRCWLADDSGGGVTAYAPNTVTWNAGVVLQTIETKKHYLVITPYTGVADVSVNYLGTGRYYWGVCRQGRVYYSSQLYFA
jgi:hypothetical protein